VSIAVNAYSSNDWNRLTYTSEQLCVRYLVSEIFFKFEVLQGMKSGKILIGMLGP